MGAFVIIIKRLRAGPPPVHIIVAHHIQFVQELFGSRPGFRTDLVIRLGHPAFRIQFPAYALQLSCRQIPFRDRLIRYLISDAPDYDRRMVSVAQEHRADVLLMAAVKPL